MSELASSDAMLAITSNTTSRFAREICYRTQRSSSACNASNIVSKGCCAISFKASKPSHTASFSPHTIIMFGAVFRGVLGCAEN